MISLRMHKIVITTYFKKQIKKLFRKDKDFKDELKKTLLNFNKSNSISIGNGVYKVRMKKDGSGKSSGYRLYIFLIEVEGIIAPITVFSKNEKANLRKSEISDHLENIIAELKS